MRRGIHQPLSGYRRETLLRPICRTITVTSLKRLGCVMGYITGYLRKNRNRLVTSPEIESAQASTNESVFQIDYETWYACLAGWSPIPMQTVGALMLLKPRERKSAKAA
jgi:hypothetical protein